MIFNPAPIVTEPDQPDCFEYALLQLETKMLIKSLTWKSDRVIDYLNKLHSAIGWNPITPEQSRLGLNRNQLLTLLKKLNHATT